MNDHRTIQNKILTSQNFDNLSSSDLYCIYGLVFSELVIIRDGV